MLYVAESAGRRVRRIALATNNVTTVATLRYVPFWIGITVSDGSVIMMAIYTYAVIGGEYFLYHHAFLNSPY